MTDNTPHIELYKKYRPKVWGGLIGQEKVAKSLQSAVLANKIPTAYLFAGDRGCGKTTAAFILAKAVNCEAPVNGNPCNKCETCVNIDKGIQLGVTYISAANNGGTEDIRDLVKQARLQQPVKRQVFIVDEIHTIHRQAFDSLLIPLEEKSMPALFIFCTTEINKVPKTILSRVQQRRFSLVDADTMLKYITLIAKKEELNLSESDLETIVKMGRGSVRDTLTAIESVLSTGVTTTSFGGRLLESLATRNVAGTLKVIAEAQDENVDMRSFTEQLFEDLRDLLLLANGCGKDLVGVTPVMDEATVIRGLGESAGLILFMKSVAEAITNISSGGDNRILLEVAVLQGLGNLKKLDKILQSR